MEAELVMALVSQGMRMWADYADRAAKGTLTDADIGAMADHLKVDIDGFKADMAAKKAAKA